MQKISSSCCADIIETDGAFITGVRGMARRWSFYIRNELRKLLGQMKAPLLCASLERRHEIEIMYFGRASEFLQMTLERMVIPDEGHTLVSAMTGGRMNWMAVTWYARSMASLRCCPTLSNPVSR